jgi:hypothetical protein
MSWLRNKKLFSSSKTSCVSLVKTLLSAWKTPIRYDRSSAHKTLDGDYLAAFGYITKKPSLAAYKLQEYVLRQEVVALATRIGDVEIPDYYQCRNIFADVSASKPNSWACRVIENAYDEWIVSKDSNYFGPEAKISLVEAVGILLRAGDIKIQKYSGGEIEPWKINIIGTCL